jgi:hypothetical protein
MTAKHHTKYHNTHHACHCKFQIVKFLQPELFITSCMECTCVWTSQFGRQQYSLHQNMKDYVYVCMECTCVWTSQFGRQQYSLHQNMKDYVYVCMHSTQKTWKRHHFWPRLGSVERLVVKYATKIAPGRATNSATDANLDSKGCAIAWPLRKP